MIFNDLYNDTALNFIHDFPHPELFINRRIDFLTNYLAEKNGSTIPGRFKKKVNKMKELSANSLYYVSADSYHVQNLKQTIELILCNKKEINKIKNQLINSLKDTKLFKNINSIPGFGEFSTAIFLAEVGDITRFDTKYQFISFMGIAWVTSLSAKAEYHGHLSKSRSYFGKRILFDAETTIF